MGGMGGKEEGEKEEVWEEGRGKEVVVREGLVVGAGEDWEEVVKDLVAEEWEGLGWEEVGWVEVDWVREVVGWEEVGWVKEAVDWEVVDWVVKD